MAATAHQAAKRPAGVPRRRPYAPPLAAAHAIHAIANPGDEAACALHLYGGDFGAIQDERSLWDGQTHAEMDFSFPALVKQSVSTDTAAEWAENIVAYRQEPMHWDFLGESDWYRNRMAGYNDISLETDLINTQSKYFAVKMTGKSGVGRKSILAYLERRKPEKEEQGQVSVSIRYWEVY